MGNTHRKRWRATIFSFIPLFGVIFILVFACSLIATFMKPMHIALGVSVNKSAVYTMYIAFDKTKTISLFHSEFASLPLSICVCDSNSVVVFSSEFTQTIFSRARRLHRIRDCALAHKKNTSTISCFTVSKKKFFSPASTIFFEIACFVWLFSTLASTFVCAASSGRTK